MDMRIGVKTNKTTKCPFISYFGFFDPDAEIAGVVEPYRHIDGDDMEYKRTVYGYLVTVKDVYDITNGRYITEDELKKLKLMYADIEQDCTDASLKIDRVWRDDGNDWMNVINFM